MVRSSVELEREIPEQLRPRRIEVGVPTATAVGQNSQPRLAEQSKAARFEVPLVSQKPASRVSPGGP